jgi:DNA polymerase I
MENKNKKIILIDGNNIAYRAFYALPDTISTSSGVITNAVLGFTSMLLKLIEEQEPDSIACAFDSKTPTFRHKMFERYKIKRKKMPEELGSQLPLIKEVLSVFNIACLEKEGYEADDILAGITEKIKDDFGQIIIVTGDKDMLQLVSGNIKVMSLKKGITDIVFFDSRGVKEKFGVKPENIKDLLALMGDSSDNIPGVAGIGPKTARLLISEYGSVEEIYKNIDRISNRRLKDMLLENKNLAELSKELATLRMSSDMDTKTIINASFKNIDINRVKRLFGSLEFRNLEKRLYSLKNKINFQEERPTSKETVINIKLKPVTDEAGMNSLNKNIANNKKIYVAECIKEDKFYGLILYDGGENAIFVGEDELSAKKVKEELKEIFENKKNIVSGFDLKQIYKTLKKKDIVIRSEFIDYKILYLILNSGKSTAELDEIIYDILNIEVKGTDSPAEVSDNVKEEIPENLKEDEGKKQLKLDFYKRKEEAKQDYDEGFLLKELSLYKKVEDELLKRLKKEGAEKLYRDIEEPLIKVLAEMEYTGVNIDKDYLNNLIKEYDSNIKKLQEEIYDFCNEKFNINSSRQLSEILYKKLGLPAVKKTKTGLSTDAGALKSIYNSSPLIGKILDYREKTKLKNTYIDVLPVLIDSKDLRIHTTYNQLGTSTGRISSSEPNLQNIPVRTEYGKQIRKAFIPGRGYDLIMSSDYSQIELRVLAHLSEDENLIDTFKRDEDIHTRTASELFGVEYDKVDESLRRKAKTINFGIIYGMTEYGLAERLSISEEEAREYIEKYFERYTGVKKYLKFLIDDAYKKGYSTTIFGRKRYLKELGSSNSRVRNLGERFAVNTPIQGSAADIMKLSTIVLFNQLKSGLIDSNIILHVHDELVLELKEKDKEAVKKMVIDAMENCVNLKVKLKVDIKTGRNWYI